MRITDGLEAFFWDNPRENNCNSYLLGDPPRVLIDPGHTHLFEHVARGLEKLGLALADLDLVIATHGHPDHLEAAARFRAVGVPFAMHGEDWRLATEMSRYLGAALDLEHLQPDIFLQAGELTVRELRLQVLHTPGHSPGSVSLWWEQRRALFSGDVVFRDGVGRADLPGGDLRILAGSIQRLAELDAEWLLPGHGDVVMGAEAVALNFKRVGQDWLGFI